MDVTEVPGNSRWPDRASRGARTPTRRRQIRSQLRHLLRCCHRRCGCAAVLPRRCQTLRSVHVYGQGL